MSKKISFVFWSPVLIAIVVLFTFTTASAKVCIFKIGGTCVFWSGSVRAQLNADKPGNIQNKSMNFTINRIEGAGIPGIVFCKNRNPNIPGVEPKPGLFTGIMNSAVDVKPGHIKEVETETGTKTAVVVPAFAELKASELRSLDPQCGDPRLEAKNFVPSEFQTQVSLVNKNRGTVDSWAIIECTLPNHETLGWDEANDRPEERQYNCKRSRQK